MAAAHDTKSNTADKAPTASHCSQRASHFRHKRTTITLAFVIVACIVVYVSLFWTAPLSGSRRQVVVSGIVSTNETTAETPTNSFSTSEESSDDSSDSSDRDSTQGSSRSSISTIARPDMLHETARLRAEGVAMGRLDADGDYRDYDGTNAGRPAGVKTSSSGDALDRYKWIGTQCSIGAGLSDPSLVAQCDYALQGHSNDSMRTDQSGERLPLRWCHWMHAAKKRDTTYCADHLSGMFDPPLSSEVLRTTLHALRARRDALADADDAEGIQSAGSSARPKCASAAYFSGRVTPQTMSMRLLERPLQQASSSYPLMLQSGPWADVDGFNKTDGTRYAEGKSAEDVRLAMQQSTGNGQQCCRKSFFYLSPIEAMSVLHDHAARDGNDNPRPEGISGWGKGILFSGDSLSRQLFINIIAHIRGSPVVTDYYYHRDAIYVVYPTHDVHETLHSESRKRYCALLAQWFPGYPITSKGGDGESARAHKKRRKAAKRAISECLGNFDASNAETPLFVMLFVWDVTPIAYRQEALAIRNVAVHVGSFMLWWYGTDNMSMFNSTLGPMGAPVNVSIAPYLSHLERTLAADAHRKFLWLTTPLLSKNTLVHQMLGPLGVRNEKMRRWVRDGTDWGVPLLPTVNASVRNFVEDPFDWSPAAEEPASDTEPTGRKRQRWLVDFAGIADVAKLAGVAQRADNVHFTCGWWPIRYGPISALRGNGQACRDPVNGAVMQWLMHLLMGI